MCALENPTSVPGVALSRAVESLQALLRTTTPSQELIAEAADALEELRNQLRAAHHWRMQLGESNRRDVCVSEAAGMQMERLDSEIIRAKLEAGELLTVRDSIARDLGRARKTLAILEEEREGELDSLPIAGSTEGSGVPRKSLEFGGEGDIAKLAEFVAGEMEKMHVAEKNMVEVVEEISAIRKRRAELETKVRAAKEEW